MKVYTCGDFNKPKLVIINPFMNDNEKAIKIIRKLAKKYYVVLPILTGYYPNSTFSSMHKEELELSIFLKSHNLNRIDLMIGFSFGGNMAFDFFAKNTDIIDRLIIDSAPLFDLPFVIKKYAFYKYHKVIINVLKNRDKIDEILEKENSSLLYQKDIIPMITDKTLKNVINTCFNIPMYNINRKQQSKITFIYTDKDKSRYAKWRLRKYRYCNHITINNAEHCQYFMQKTDSYIKKIINK